MGFRSDDLTLHIEYRATVYVKGLEEPEIARFEPKVEVLKHSSIAKAGQSAVRPNRSWSKLGTLDCSVDFVGPCRLCFLSFSKCLANAGEQRLNAGEI